MPIDSGGKVLFFNDGDNGAIRISSSNSLKYATMLKELTGLHQAVCMVPW